MQHSPLGRWLHALLLLALLALLASAPARADTPIALFKSYAGNLNFTGTQKTMRTAPNTTNACSVNTGTLSAALSGIPAGSTVVSAQLYWAGSNSVALADYTVTFDGAAVTAPANRQYTTNSTGSVYFSGAVDVTAQVAAKGNGTYTFGGLTIDTSSTYCASEAVLGGFSLLVVYANPSETFRVLNLYEGFQYIRTYGVDDVSVSLTLSNFMIPTPLGSATGRIGHITWEGDPNLLGTGEELRFNGTEMVDASNPTGNQFNSVSNINGDSNSYGIDFDAYVLASPVIQAGQTSATTTYKSGQDQVLLSAEIVAVPNVPVADLGLALARGGLVQRGQTITYTLTASNAGPGAEPGPTTVTTTLPTGLAYVSAAGTGWSCSAAGQTVTCSRTGSIAVGAAVPPLVLSLAIAANAPPTMVTSATIDGAMFDNISANNTVTDTISFASDLAITMLLTDTPLTLGQGNSFQIGVVNNGPYKDDGPITVTTTLPGVLRYLSGGGNGWACSAAGQDLTCSYAGSLDVGASTPPLMLFFTVESYAAGAISTTATVSGTGSDTTPANDSATVSSTLGIPGYVFTDSACVRSIAFGAAGQTCNVLGWTNRVAGVNVQLYVTDVNAAGVPTRVSTSNTNVTLGFALSCHNPTTGNGTLPVFAGATLGACKAAGATPTTFTNFSMPFPANVPSSGPYTFTYNDTGRVEFFVKDSAANLGSSGQYIYKPAGFALSTVATNPYAGMPNLVAVKFAVAGANFGLNVTALTSTGIAAKNYGREIAPEGVALDLSGAIDSGTGLAYAEMVNLPPLGGSFGSFTLGVASGAAFHFDEVGAIRLVPGVGDGDFLGLGDVSGTALSIGRFVPAYFDTAVLIVIACTPGLTAMAPCTGTGMHYSSQPIGATVSAFNAFGAPARNYQGRLAKAVTLTGVAASGGSALGGGAGTLGAAGVPPASFASGVAPAAPTFALPAGAAPLDVFLRATENSGGDGVVSLRTAVPSATTVEGGTRVALGRLQVANIYGSELLSMRVPLRAQYWNGARWENSVNDSVSTVVVTSAAMTLADCRFNLAGSYCSAPTLAPNGATGVQSLNGGMFMLGMKATGRIGSANLTMAGSSPWLPSTAGRLTFGVYKATPLIYIREIF